MTISSTQTRISYNGNGVTTQFAFPYLFLAAADLQVRLVDAVGAVTLLTLNTDYTVTDILGYKKVTPIDGGALDAGDAFTIDYQYDKPAHRTFKPATRTLREGRALIQGVSDIGNEFEYEIAYCSLAPSGDTPARHRAGYLDFRSRSFRHARHPRRVRPPGPSLAADY